MRRAGPSRASRASGPSRASRASRASGPSRASRASWTSRAARALLALCAVWALPAPDASSTSTAALAATLAPLATTVPAPPAPPATATAAPAAIAAGTPADASATDYAAVVAGRPIAFPQDFGSHPEFRTEWWYVTGWLTTGAGEPLGFQITFFRTKPSVDPANPSAFSPHQLLVAHAAISDRARGRLWQDQRIRRAGLGLAEASAQDTDVFIDPWSLKRTDHLYRARIDADGFAMQLSFEDTQAPLLNGASGVSRKGPAAAAASYYYSLPHMRVAGTVDRGGRTDAVHGEAWFDHEWSSEYLDPQASGWDWVGINLDDGAALMAFRIRGLDGSTHWAGGTYRSPGGGAEILDASAVQFTARRSWTSPRTGTRYPVEWTVRAGARQFDLEPLMDDQENDTRLSTGAIYWEGAVRALQDGAPVGKGYLELTGYGERLRLR